MSSPSSFMTRRLMVMHLGSGFRLICRRLSVTGNKPQRVFSGQFEASSAEAYSALVLFADSRPVGKAVPIFHIDLGAEPAVAVLYAFSRRFGDQPTPRVVADLIFEEIQPRDDLSYVVIDEKTDFRASDYQSCLDRLRAKETTCHMKP